MIEERLLLGPGPSNPYPEAMQAIARPVLGHLDPQFLAILDETCERLRRVFRTRNELTLPVSGTGSAGMEACLVNLLEPGDTAIVGVNGYFGERLCEIARRTGAEVIRVEERWGRALDPERLLHAQGERPKARVVAVVHAETSTGVENDVAPLAALQGTGSLLIVDAVTSLGGIPVEVDAWGVDACYSGSQKCLGVPPGLAPVTFSPRAVERLRTRQRSPQSWYLDLGLIGAYVGADRKYHHTAPVSMVFALHAALAVILDEGLNNVWERHRRVGALLHAGLENAGFELFAEQGHRLPQLTAVFLPEGVEEAPHRQALLERYGIEVGGGLGDFFERMWRIGLMGHSARERSVVTLLGAIHALVSAPPRVGPDAPAPAVGALEKAVGGEASLARPASSDVSSGEHVSEVD